MLRFLSAKCGRKMKNTLLALLLIVSLNAGVFTLIREVLSGMPKYGYELFSADEIAAAEFIKDNMEPDAVFLTDDNHDNAVAVLTGRNIVCGSGSYLYFHGVDYGQQRQDAESMLTDQDFFERYKDVYGLDFVYLGCYEKAMDGVIDEYLSEEYPVVFENDSISIYDVR